MNSSISAKTSTPTAHSSPSRACRADSSTVAASGPVQNNAATSSSDGSSSGDRRQRCNKSRIAVTAHS